MAVTGGSLTVSDKDSIDALHVTVKSAIAAAVRSEKAMRDLTKVGLVVAVVGAILAGLQAYAAFYPGTVQCAPNQASTTASKS